MGDIRTPTKKLQDEAEEKGRKRREAIENDPQHGGSPKDDEYDDMTPGQKEAYKKGYRGD